MISFDSDINIARQEFKRVLIPLTVGICAGGMILFLLSGCGFNQIGPETVITADTQCGRVHYDSTKEQQGPGARCVVRKDANGTEYYTFEMGSNASIGGSSIAGSVAQGIVEGIKVAK